jgi:hypothetical protein
MSRCAGRVDIRTWRRYRWKRLLEPVAGTIGVFLAPFFFFAAWRTGMRTYGAVRGRTAVSEFFSDDT